MLAGIGVLIIASQFHIMIDDAPKGSGLTNLASLPAAAWKRMLPDNSTPMNLRLIPTASLGTVLVFTGYQLINVQAIKELAQQGREEVAIYAATLGTIVATNLLTGVLVGVALAMAKLIYTTQNLHAYCHTTMITDS